MDVGTDEIRDDVIVEETPEYSPKSEFNKAQIISDCVRKCNELRAKPMTPGHVNTSQSSDGTTKKEETDDTRQAYISAVITLLANLRPEIKRDNNFLKFYKEIEDELERLKRQYEYEDVTWELNGTGYRIKKTGRRFIPEIDAVLKTETFNASTKTLEIVKGYWNSYVNAYWDSLVDVYDEIFAEIQCLIDRLNYFKPEISF